MTSSKLDHICKVCFQKSPHARVPGVRTSAATPTCHSEDEVGTAGASRAGGPQGVALPPARFRRGCGRLADGRVTRGSESGRRGRHSGTSVGARVSRGVGGGSSRCRERGAAGGKPGCALAGTWFPLVTVLSWGRSKRSEFDHPAQGGPRSMDRVKPFPAPSLGGLVLPHPCSETPNGAVPRGGLWA